MKSVRLSAFVDKEGQIKMGSFDKRLLQGFSNTAVYLVVEEKIISPTQNQRGFYFGVVLPMWRMLLMEEDVSNEVISVQDLHKLAVREFMPAVEKIIDIENAVYKLEEPSTKEGKASKVMYALLIESVILYVADYYGVVIESHE